jgi:diaminohydroxyphosphoribosylaminopyrimidine deaminase/5-amino-6-(5-phosphoribosylamino)uracil reductase
MAEPRIVIPVVAGSSPVGHPTTQPLCFVAAVCDRRTLPPPRMTRDEKFMREAIRLARKGIGQTRPNPAVGCVIVKDGRIIGRGWHRRAGLPHAEVEALKSLGKSADGRGATAYVTLEPCSTHGRTPPCTRALIDAGVARVVMGTIDPNPKHCGRALELLRQAGIKTKTNVLAAECEALNPEFNHAMRTGLPWVVAKCGMSLDGRLTRPPGEGQWITSPAARRDAMKLRAGVDAILVGAATVRADDPSLTLRGIKGEQPWRIVWAPRGGVPRRAKIFTDAHRGRTIVLRQRTLGATLRALAKRGIHSVLVEGGGHTLGALFHEALADEAVFYVAPLLAGGIIPSVAGPDAMHREEKSKSGVPPLPISLRNTTYARLGNCIRVQGKAASETLR